MRVSAGLDVGGVVKDRYRWPDAEVEILRETYPHGGMKAALAQLPHLTPNIVRRKVELLGLRTLNRAQYRKQPTSEWIDAAIRRDYKDGRPQLKKLAITLGRELGWVKWRASVLGVCRAKPARWSPAEDVLLDSCIEQCMSVVSIHNRFKKHGFQRSHGAILSHIDVRKLSMSRAFWTAREVAQAMAVDNHVFLRWLESGKMKGKRGPGPSSRKNIDNLQSLMWQVKPKDVQRFMVRNPECWDHRRMRREMLIDLLVGDENGLTGGCWGAVS